MKDKNLMWEEIKLRFKKNLKILFYLIEVHRFNDTNKQKIYVFVVL